MLPVLSSFNKKAKEPNVSSLTDILDIFLQAIWRRIQTLIEVAPPFLNELSHRMQFKAIKVPTVNKVLLLASSLEMEYSLL